MNIENIEKVKKAMGVIAAFNMNEWESPITEDEYVVAHKRPEIVHDCDTVCCIGGTAEMLMREEGINIGENDAPSMYKWLGLNEHEGDDLCFPLNLNMEWSRITIEHAERALDNIVEHGEARWDDVVEDLK